MLNSDRWNQCIFTQPKWKWGTIIKHFMGLINSHKINEGWPRAVRQTVNLGEGCGVIGETIMDEGGLNNLGYPKLQELLRWQTGSWRRKSWRRSGLQPRRRLTWPGSAAAGDSHLRRVGRETIQFNFTKETKQSVNSRYTLAWGWVFRGLSHKIDIEQTIIRRNVFKRIQNYNYE